MYKASFLALFLALTPVFGEDPKPEPVIKLLVRPINVPAARFAGVTPLPNAKAIPQPLSKAQKYVIDWDNPLVVDFQTPDGGAVKIVERKGPRPYASANLISVHKPDADNEDVTTIAGPFIYEVTVELKGMIFLNCHPALPKVVDGKPVPLTKADNIYRTLAADGAEPPEPPGPDEDAAVLALRRVLDPSFQKDGNKSKLSLVADLAKMYKKASEKGGQAYDTSYRTWDDLLLAMQAARKGIMADDIMLPLREVLATELNSKFPTVPGVKLDDDGRKRAADEFKKASLALAGLKAN